METIHIDRIDTTGRQRPVDEDVAVLYASSIEEKGKGVEGEGLDQAILVTPRGDGFKLVYGGHRLRALQILGWTELVVGKHVKVAELTDDEAELTEIDENLLRADLNPLDRALQLAKRKSLYEKMNKVAGHGGARKADKVADASKSQSLRLGFSPRFTSDVADRVGFSERAVQLSLRIAEKLDPIAIAELRGTKIERNQQQLLQLCDMTPDEQRAIARTIGKSEAASVAAARVAIGLDKKVVADEQTRVWANLLASWEKASKQTRAAFLKEIGAALVKKGD